MKKTFELTVKHDNGTTAIRTVASDIAAAKSIICAAEGCPGSAVQSWRVVPTKRQIARTKSLLRGL